MSKKIDAVKILADVPEEHAFHFYTDIGVDTGMNVRNLKDFCEALTKVDTRSLEFHVSRGDFENWLRFLGDSVLAVQVAKLRNKNVKGDELKTKLTRTARNRYNKLSSSV